MVRIAVVEKEKCHPDRCGNFLCMRLCPVNRTGIECITEGDDFKAKIDASTCTGCGICPKRCPFGAIHIINLPEALDKTPVHQYGYNDFRLFNLPVPIFGKVLGIIGKNGIGKSTAIKILAGALKANLSDYKKEKNIDDLINFFKGTELQIFFSKLKNREIKISYKPQAVDMIPKQAKGKVIDLLKKVDEKNELDKIIKELELERFLNSKIDEISGGELQRVAIAATVLKKANVYIFDEPSSYLDIKQRIKLSKFIRNLANEETAVIVVEHDLVILDHMADLIQILYGETGAYGVVSGTKTTRAGINVYLSGYLKEENIRFREHEIKFLAKPVKKVRDEEIIISWNNIELTLGSFNLTAPEGKIPRKQVIGILGENGIGKTSFVRILAGELKPKGQIDEKATIAYKPQYLSTTSNESVQSFLQKAIQDYEVQLIRPLGILHLFEKSLNELSGGELQRVMIAKCLSEDADLFLLDEPSAYLDIEQRLIVSRLIKERMEQTRKTALVVDHDLLFADYLSDKLIVFKGIPATNGIVEGPFSMEDGMNKFLKNLNITLRRDHETLRPRINKEDSQLDREQKAEGKLYYT
jgi:ATP-binding cassette subfamily E protein 1